jgi:hypothetical protein
VTVVVRPEVLRFTSEERGRTMDDTRAAGVVWTGVVRQRIFRGARNLYTVESGALRLTVDAPPDQSVAAGRAVTLAVDSAHTWVVRD